MSRKTEEEEKRNGPLGGGMVVEWDRRTWRSVCLAKALGSALKTLSNF